MGAPACSSASSTRAWPTSTGALVEQTTALVVSTSPSAIPGEAADLFANAASGAGAGGKIDAAASTDVTPPQSLLF
eukprot:1696562-Prymnesium_polylepis.1